MESNSFSLNYVTLLYGVSRLLVAFYAFFLVGIKGEKTVDLPFRGFQRAFLLSVGLWELTRAMFFLYPGTILLPRFMSFIYVVVPFTSLTYFYFCFAYTFPQKIHLMKYLIWLSLIPIVTAILSIVPEYNQYFIIFTDTLVYIPYRDTTDIYKPWFYVHTAYSYLLVLAGIACLVMKVKNPSIQSRRFYVYAIIATILFILNNMYRTFFPSNDAIWFTPILSISVLTMFFFIVHGDEAQVIVNRAQEKLMQTLLFPIFFLNEDKGIIYASQEALNVCPNIVQGSTITGNMQDIMENFSPAKIDSQFVQNDLLAEGTNILLQSKGDGRLYYLHEQNLTTNNSRSHHKGKLLTLIDVSTMQNFFSSLEEKAFRDPLCGCYNRHYLEIKQAELSQTNDELKKLLPISFIVCDIDGLKIVNDTHGHETGNEYILLCYNKIKSAIRQDDLIFRLGGDEFLIILSNTGKNAVERIVSSIELKMQQEKRSYCTSISIGTATAETIPIDYDTCFQEADEQMYKKKAGNKKLRKNPGTPDKDATS